MKFAYITVRADVEVTLPQSALDALPQSLVLFVTSQCYHKVQEIKAQLESAGKVVRLVQTRHTNQPGQILGCNTEKVDGDFDAFLYVGDGLFHPKALLFNNSQPVFMYNPFAKEFLEVDRAEAQRLVKQRKAAQAAFLHAKNVGVLVTTKPGQEYLRTALRLEERWPDKEFFVFIANTLDLWGLDDFNFVDVWVNTACPRIAYEDENKVSKPIIYFEELEGWLETPE